METVCVEEKKFKDRSKLILDEIASTNGFKIYDFRMERSCEKGINYLGEIYRTAIVSLRKDDIGKSLKLIIKTAPFSKTLRKILTVNKIYRREIFMYSIVIPTLESLQSNLSENDKFKCAKFYKGVEDEYAEMIVMEDLAVDGFKSYNRFKSFDYDHLSLCVKTLARIHAASFVMKTKHKELFHELCEFAFTLKDYGTSFEPFIEKNRTAILKIVKGEKYEERVRDFIKNIPEYLTKYTNPDTSYPYNVLCHGDCWSSNILFKYHDEKVIDIRFLDWQTVRVLSPVTDLYHLIYLTTDKKIRLQYYKEMLDLYYATLSKNITSMGYDVNLLYPENIYKDHLENYLKFALTDSLIALLITLADDGQDLDNIIIKPEENGSAEFKISSICKTRLKEIIEEFLHYKVL